MTLEDFLQKERDRALLLQMDASGQASYLVSAVLRLVDVVRAQQDQLRKADRIVYAEREADPAWAEELLNFTEFEGSEVIEEKFQRGEL